MKWACRAVVIMLVVAGSAFGRQRTITVAQAKSLVVVILRHQKFNFPPRNCELELLSKDGKAFVPDYYTFGASCDYPHAPTTTPFGTYVVSPRTGEVWEFNLCTEFTYPELLELRRKLVPQSEATKKAEAKYRVTLGCQQMVPAKN